MTNAPHVIMLFVAIFLFGGIFYGPWQTLCVDWARQQMFEARNELFRLAEEGKWSFEAEEYRKARLHIERMIRFAHCVSWPRLGLYSLLLMVPVADRKEPPNLKMIVASIENDEARAEVDKQLSKVVVAIVTMVLWRSAILLLLTAITIIGYRCYEPMRRRLKMAGWHAYILAEADAQTMERVKSPIAYPV